MKPIRPITLALAALLALPWATAAAHEGHKKDAAASTNAAAGKLVPVTEKDKEFVAQAKASYPTNLCIVSDDKLGGDMGKPADYIYRVEGKPDRLVRFCCKDCVADFNKDPEKYLKILDSAAAKKGDTNAKHPHSSG